MKKRLRQLAASLDRLAAMDFTFGQRYVVVNLPAAAIEAVAGGKVVRRHAVVVGKPDRPVADAHDADHQREHQPDLDRAARHPQEGHRPQDAQGPGYLARMHMRLLDGAGREIDPATVDWNSDRALAFTFRQDPGPWNALGVVRIDMPNPHSVYMHDTNHRNLFSADYRFQSSGCTRVSDPRDFAAWVLQDTPGWNRARFEAGVDAQRIDVRVAHNIPVAWIYLTGWASRDGTMHFRNDIYRQDEPAGTAMVTAAAAYRSRSACIRVCAAIRRSGAGRLQVSYLDSQ